MKFNQSRSVATYEQFLLF